MRPMPKGLRERLSADPFYGRCCITGKPKNQQNKIEWHHNFIFAGRQVNEKWCILPIIEKEHDEMRPETRERLDWIMLNRADEETLKKYSKAVDLTFKRDRLNKTHGQYEEAKLSYK